MYKPIPRNNTTVEHPAIFMMQQWQLFMEGIDRIMTFYMSDDNTCMEGIEWNKALGENLSPILISEDVNNKLQAVANEKAAYQWLPPELLPFMEMPSIGLNQLNLFSESVYLVLLIRNKTSESKWRMTYLFFRNDTSNFGISDSQSQLETSHKAIIGKMASRFAQISIRNHIASKTKEETFRQHTRSILNNKQIEANKNIEAHNSWKNDWLDTYLNYLRQRDGLNYVISESARNKLLSNTSSFEICKKAVDNCTDYICNLFTITPGDIIAIEESYLVLETRPPSSHADNYTSTVPSRSSKTMHLLDRLEESANKLQHQGLSITSADVGANMPKPISAPAISDALRKNRVRILQLLEQYPHRWKTIRQSFKPITNLITKNNLHLSASG